MANKIDKYEFETKMTMREIEKVLNNAFAKMGVESRQSIGGSTADMAIQVKGKPALLSPFIYVLEIYVWDNGDRRTIQVNAVGSGGATYFGTALTGQTGVYMDLKSAKKKRNILLKLFGEKW